MKRLSLIIMIVIVLGVVGYYTLRELRSPEIVFVRDIVSESSQGNQTAIHRLYNSGVDVGAFQDMIESNLISAEFTDEEIETAALASGTPEFYPTFYMNIYSPDPSMKIFTFNGLIKQEIAPKQTTTNFNYKNVHLEMTSENFEIKNFKYDVINDNIKSANAPVISEDRRALAMNLDNLKYYNFDLFGENGTVTFKFTYDIVTNRIFPSTVMTGQLLIVHANINYSEESGVNIEFINEPYFSLDDLE